MKINKHLTEINRWRGRFGEKVRFIVIHYTAGDGDTARGNALYFASEYRAASAHFFVDRDSVWQSVELDDSAWHCGDATSRNGCGNLNSVGVELCSKKDSRGEYYIPDETAALGAELVRYLLTLYPGATVCRHYDVTGKVCPRPWVLDESLWKKFLRSVAEGEMTDEEKKRLLALEKKTAELEKKTAGLEKSGAELLSKTGAVEKKTGALWDEVGVKWAYIDGNMPDWMKPTVKKLVRKGYLRGGSKKSLGISYQFARVLVILDRAGAFDK